MPRAAESRTYGRRRRPARRRSRTARRERRTQHAQGLRRDAEAGLPQADHAAVSGVPAARVPALPGAAPAAQARERPREVRRLLALRGRVPGRLHPRGRGREHGRQPRLGRRALRTHLRDQHEPLHLLRLLRARVPVRCDHARQRVRAVRVLARRPHLHEGHSPRRADQARAGPGSQPVRHARPLLQGAQLVLVASAGNVLVWMVWIVAAFACLGSGVAVVSFSNPFYSALALIGNLGSLAVLYLLLNAEFVAAAQVLVYAGAVMVMFLFVIAYIGPRSESPWAGGPSWQAVGAVLAAGALLVEIVVVIGLEAGGQLAHSEHVGATFGTPAYIGRLFLTDHLLAFEITSIVLLVAAIGGVILGAHSRRSAADKVPSL